MKQQYLYHQPRNKKEIRCAACGNIIKVGEQKLMHHTSYYPEKKVPVHKSCHAKIHWGTAYEDLMPDPRQTQRFYRGTRLGWNCIFNLGWRKKSFDTVVPQFFNYVDKLEKYNIRHQKEVQF